MAGIYQLAAIAVYFFDFCTVMHEVTAGSEPNG
jgi:hypothetical protein